MKKYMIIDTHSHIFPTAIAGKANINVSSFYDLPMECSKGDTTNIIRAGKAAGINAFIVCSPATIPRAVKSINRFISEEAEKTKSFIGFGSVHPYSPTLEEDIKTAKELGLKGVKLHPDFQHFPIDCNTALEMYNLLEKYNLPILMHMGDARFSESSPQRLHNVLLKMPELHVIAAHLGGFQRWTESLRILDSSFKNLRFDTSSAIRFLGIEKTRQLIEHFGTERVFFGSDFPMSMPATEIRRFLSLGFSDSDNERILAENVLEYLNLDRKAFEI